MDSTTSESNDSAGFLFPHSVEAETREPLFRFTVPAFLGEPLFGGPSDGPTELGFVLFDLSYWIELLGLLLVVLSLFAITGLLLYKTVIQPRKKETAAYHAYLIGFGFVLPFWVSWPVLLLGFVDIRNAIFRFMLAGILPILCFFRTMEVVCGLCPEHNTKSEGDFLFYFATVPIPARAKQTQNDKAGSNGGNDNENASNKPASSTKTTLQVGDPIPCSNSKKGKHLARFLGFLFLTGALQSVLTPHHNMDIFGTGLESSSTHNAASDDRSEWYSAKRYGTWQLYANSALHAMLFQLYLCTYIEALSLVFAVATGFEAEPAMDNPLLKSRSVIEFWGKRWNTLVHTVLKNGVYKPLRKCCGASTGFAILATFLSSGVFHEWLVWAVFAAGTLSSDRSGTFDPDYGGSMVFFAWQALLIGAEMAACNTALGKAVAAKLPTPVRTFLVVAAGIPPAHFFIAPYARSNFFFHHGAGGLPMLVRVA